MYKLYIKDCNTVTTHNLHSEMQRQLRIRTFFQSVKYKMDVFLRYLMKTLTNESFRISIFAKVS
jgi:hypothetical protein